MQRIALVLTLVVLTLVATAASAQTWHRPPPSQQPEQMLCSVTGGGRGPDFDVTRVLCIDELGPFMQEFTVRQLWAEGWLIKAVGRDILVERPR